MSGRMRERHTNQNKYIEIIIGLPGMEEFIYKIPYTPSAKERLKTFLQKLTQTEGSSKGDSIVWEKIAADRIARHTESGLALRGARYRLGISQKKLAKLCGISQENLSRMENGKRAIGINVAKKLAKILSVDYRLLLSSSRRKKVTSPK